jgi:hypothetical protein
MAVLKETSNSVGQTVTVKRLNGLTVLIEAADATASSGPLRVSGA